MIPGIIYSLDEGLIEGVEALNETFRVSGVEATRLALQDLEFVKFQCKSDALSAIDIVYFLTNDLRVETLARIFLKANKTVVNAEHLQKRFSKLTVQYILFDNDLPIPDNYFSLAAALSGKLARQLSFPIIAKSHRHMDQLLVINNLNDQKLLREIGDTSFPCYFEKYFDDDHVVFKAYVIATDVYFDAVGLTYASAALKRLLKKIGPALFLEAYSVDCVASRRSNRIYFIDVNPAPAFFGSIDARIRFAEYLKCCKK
jgi:glutathione synthase/RimK-type ligase-like ATP-grasp enzyme